MKLLGGIVVKMTAASERGVPDRLVLIYGQMYLVELKTLNGAVSPIQRVWHNKIRTTGNRVHVLYGQPGVTNWLRLVTEAAHPAKRPYRRRTSA